MYIEVKKTKNKYQLYLIHSKRVNGKSTKLINQYLCSIEKDRIEGIPTECYDVVVDDVRDSIQQGLDNIPQQIRVELADEFKNLGILIINKLKQLASIQSTDEV